jgi:NAD-dependent oxidoreductase involved in siderophore biosynthesis
MSVYTDMDLLIKEVVAKTGKDIRCVTPLAAGKGNLVLNGLYQFVKANPDYKLTIMTALTLEKPKGKSLLEKNFYGPMAQRVFWKLPRLGLRDGSHKK